MQIFPSKFTLTWWEQRTTENKSHFRIHLYSVEMDFNPKWVILTVTYFHNELIVKYVYPHLTRHIFGV